jgi:cadherin EGF LAG seven-pass G-type receptor 1
VTTFIAHFLFVYGINANKSQLGCKLIAIAQYYFSTCGYLWYAIGSVHLYRMLTELRDINTTKRSPPLVYYLAAYILALLSTGLTLGLKNDLFTNFDSTLSLIVPFNSPAAAHHFDMSSLFCWLNVNQQTEIVYAYFVPILILISVGLVLLGLAYRQLRLNTFKQTDVGLANQSILASLILLPLMSASTLSRFKIV